MCEFGFLEDEGKLELLKHGQELAAHFWAAFGVLLGAIYSSKGIKLFGGSH
jgi:hypothetical protein